MTPDQYLPGQTLGHWLLKVDFVREISSSESFWFNLGTRMGHKSNVSKLSRIFYLTDWVRRTIFGAIGFYWLIWQLYHMLPSNTLLNWKIQRYLSYLAPNSGKYFRWVANLFFAQDLFFMLFFISGAWFFITELSFGMKDFA